MGRVRGRVSARGGAKYFVWGGGGAKSHRGEF